MKSKLEEITEKLNKYETMIHNLGKEYVGSVFSNKDIKKANTKK